MTVFVQKWSHAGCDCKLFSFGCLSAFMYLSFGLFSAWFLSVNLFVGVFVSLFVCCLMLLLLLRFFYGFQINIFVKSGNIFANRFIKTWTRRSNDNLAGPKEAIANIAF